MKLTRARKYEKILRKTRGIFYKNPLLSLGLALPLAVIPSYNLIATTAVSLSMLICFVPAVLLASLIGKRIASPWQVVVYPLVSCLLLIPTRILLVTLFPMIQDTLGIYLSLVCVNSLLMYATGKASEQNPDRRWALRSACGWARLWSPLSAEQSASCAPPAACLASPFYRMRRGFLSRRWPWAALSCLPSSPLSAAPSTASS